MQIVKGSKKNLIVIIVSWAVFLAMLITYVLVSASFSTKSETFGISDSNVTIISTSEIDDILYIGYRDGRVSAYDSDKNLMWTTTVFPSSTVTNEQGAPLYNYSSITEIEDTEYGLFIASNESGSTEKGRPNIAKLDRETGNILATGIVGRGINQIDFDSNGLYLTCYQSSSGGGDDDLIMVNFDFNLSASSYRYSRLISPKSNYYKIFVSKKDSQPYVYMLSATGALYAFDKADFFDKTGSFSKGDCVAEGRYFPLPARGDSGKDSAAYDSERNVVFLLSQQIDGKVIAVDCNLVPQTEEEKTAQTESGAEVVYDYKFTEEFNLNLSTNLLVCGLDSENGMLYVSSKLEKTVYVINIERKNLFMQYEAQYYIRQIVPSDKYGSLFIRAYDVNNKLVTSLYTYKLEQIYSWDRVNVTKTITMIIFIIAALVGILSLITFFVPKFSAWVVKTAKQLFKEKYIYLVILPFFILLIVFECYPIFSSIVYAFMNYQKGEPLTFAGLQNFRVVFGYFNDSGVWVSGTYDAVVMFTNMLIFLATDIIKDIVPPIIFAELVLALRSENAQYVVRVLCYIPGIIPGVASILVWTNGIFGDTGVINFVLRAINGEEFTAIPFLSKEGLNIFTLIMFNFPWIGGYLIMYGALRGIPPDYYEAAKLDGCPWIKRVITIDLPFITPQIKYIYIMGFINSVKNAGRIYLTTSGSLNSYTPGFAIYEFAIKGNYGQGATIGIIIFVILATMTVINLRMKTVNVDV